MSRDSNESLDSGFDLVSRPILLVLWMTSFLVLFFCCYNYNCFGIAIGIVIVVEIYYFWRINIVVIAWEPRMNGIMIYIVELC